MSHGVCFKIVDHFLCENQSFQIQNTSVLKMNKVPLVDLFKASLKCTYICMYLLCNYDKILKDVLFLYVFPRIGHLLLVRLYEL